MTILRSGSNIWSSNTTENDFMKKCPVIGYTPITSVSVTSSDSPSIADADFPAENLLTPTTHQRWQSQDTASDVYIDVNVASSDVNYVAFASHNLSGYQITIYGYTTNSPSDAVQVFALTQIPNNRPLIMEFQRGSYQTIRVKISGSGIRKIAVMYAGLLLRFNRGVKVDVDHQPITRGLKSDSLAGFSESGQFVGRLVRNNAWESRLEFSQMTDDQFNGVGENAGLMSSFLQDYSPNYPFFIAWAPDAYYQDVGYVWTTQDLIPVQSTVTFRWALTMNVRGLSGFDL